MNDTVGETRLVKECHGKNMEVIEPTADLSRVFNDKVTWEVRVEPLFIFKGIVFLSERNRAAFKPAVKNFRNTDFRTCTALASSGESYFIHVLSVEVFKTYTAEFFDFVNTAENSPVTALVAFPDRNRS